MPIYEYKCQNCEAVFDALKKMDERHTAQCPECGGTGDMKISPVRAGLDPISGDFPGATMKWERNRKQKMAQEVKQGKDRMR